ncbi:MAG: hypothetical protein VWZ86_00700, partial [Flavobacteriaceae bacterium]
MKILLQHLRNLFVFACFLSTTTLLFAQQAGIPYQAYIIDNDAGYVYGERIKDVPLANTEILLQFEVLNDQKILEYSEHKTLTTDRFGLVSTIIGRGSATPIFNTFSDIKWDGKEKTLRISIDFSNSGNEFEAHDEMGIVFIPGPAEDVIVGLYRGTGPPTATNPASPVEGSLYVDQSTGDLFSYSSATATWVAQADVVSTDAGNIVQQGSDGLVYLDAAAVVAAQSDASTTNELNTSFGVRADKLELTDAAGTLQVPLSDINTDDQNLTGASLVGTILTIDIEDGSSATVDLASLVSSGATGNGISTTTDNGDGTFTLTYDDGT